MSFAPSLVEDTLDLLARAFFCEVYNEILSIITGKYCNTYKWGRFNNQNNDEKWWNKSQVQLYLASIISIFANGEENPGKNYIWLKLTDSWLLSFFVRSKQLHTTYVFLVYIIAKRKGILTRALSGLYMINIGKYPETNTSMYLSSHYHCVSLLYVNMWSSGLLYVPY